MKRSLLQETYKLPTVLKQLLIIVSILSIHKECKENLRTISASHGSCSMRLFISPASSAKSSTLLLVINNINAQPTFEP